MPDNFSRVDGARVLADLNALRAIGAYKTGVHKPTFSEPHMRSLAWLTQRFPEADLAAEIDGIGNVSAPARKPGLNCWPARISKARTMPAGSMDRSAWSMRSKPPASSIRTRTFMARSRSPHGATRKAISALSSAAGPMSVPSPKRKSMPPATATTANHARSAARGRPCRPPARHGRTRTAYRISRCPYRARQDA